MADQKRWFKVWVSILDDPHFQELDLEDIGRWTLLGALTAFVGTKGRLHTPGAARRLREVLRMNGSSLLKEAVERLPSVLFEEGKNRDGDFCVTWKHWSKYQRDATSSERMKTLRSKRRGEERREEEIRKEKREPSLPSAASSSVPSLFQIPASVVNALDRSPRLGASPGLRLARFWQAQVRANPGVPFGQEILKAEAWLTTNRDRAPKKDLARFLHNWLGRADRATEEGGG